MLELHSRCGWAGETVLHAVCDAVSPPTVIWGSIQGTCMASGACVALSCCHGGCVGWASTASVACREPRWLLLLFSMQEIPECWRKVRLCPAHAHGVAETREVPDFPHCSKTSQHLEMEAQPLGAELPAGEFKSSCHLHSQSKGGLGSGLANFPPAKGTRHVAKDRNGFVIPGKLDMEPPLCPCQRSFCQERQAGARRATSCGVTAKYLPLLLLAAGGRQDPNLPAVSAALSLRQVLWIMPVLSRESPVLVRIICFSSSYFY